MGFLSDYPVGATQEEELWRSQCMFILLQHHLCPCSTAVAADALACLMGIDSPMFPTIYIRIKYGSTFVMAL